MAQIWNGILAAVETNSNYAVMPNAPFVTDISINSFQPKISVHTFQKKINISQTSQKDEN
jgi:hypothetical protein